MSNRGISFGRGPAAMAMTLLLAFFVTAPETVNAEDPDWCASQWGPDDEIGAANRLTPEMAARAARLVENGKTYSLATETNASTPAFGGRTIRIVVNQPGQAGGAVLGENGATYNDDVVIGNLGIGSQLDGLGHAGVDHVYYNCYEGAEIAQSGGLTKLGIEKVPPIVTRGVLLDMTEHYDTDVVPGGTVFNRAEIEAQAARQELEIEDGDVVLFHTGWMGAHGGDADAFLASEPGIGFGGAQYLADRGVVAVGADTWGVEASPGEPEQGVMAVHLLLLAHKGIYILEAIRTDELAADDVSQFMFVLGAPRLTGAVQAIVNPIAIR